MTPRIGRPPRSSEAATVQVTFRLTPAEAAACEAKLRAGESIRTWARRVALKAAGVKKTGAR